VRAEAAAATRLVSSSSSDSASAQPHYSRLHHQLTRFADLVSNHPADASRRASAVERVAAVVRTTLPGAQVHMFGSHATGLALPDSDVDILVLEPRLTQAAALGRLRRRFYAASSPALGGSCHLVHAKVPILKLTDKQTRVPVDLSVNETNGLCNSAAIRAALDAAPSLAPVLVAAKAHLRQLGLNETFNGGVGSYLLFMMALRKFDAAGYASLMAWQVCDTPTQHAISSRDAAASLPSPSRAAA